MSARGKISIGGAELEHGNLFQFVDSVRPPRLVLTPGEAVQQRARLSVSRISVEHCF